jgi:hypothetical protein
MGECAVLLTCPLTQPSLAADLEGGYQAGVIVNRMAIRIWLEMSGAKESGDRLLGLSAEHTVATREDVLFLPHILRMRPRPRLL